MPQKERIITIVFPVFLFLFLFVFHFFKEITVKTFICTTLAVKNDSNNHLRFLRKGKKQIVYSEEGGVEESVDNIGNNNSNTNLLPFDVVVVGAGLSGAVIAEQHASMLGKRVLVVEKRNHIGGNCYDYTDQDTGILVNKYGAHLFHTNNEEVWNYIRKHGKWKQWEHRVLGYVQSQYVPIPVNIETVNTLFNLSLKTPHDMNEWLKAHQINLIDSAHAKNSEEMALSRVGRELYDLIFKPYTEKQWNTSVSLLGPEVTGRIPVRDNFDNRYFSDKYQALPVEGYTKFFEALLTRNPLIEVYTGMDYFQMSPGLKARILPSAKVFYTGPIDKFFSSEKQLQYRSLKFSRLVVRNQKGYHLPAPVVNYPGAEYPFTRVVEYKHMLSQKSGSSVLFYEFPSDTGEPYYPVPTKENKALYQELVSMTKDIPNIIFVGRLANYKYFNMDEAIANALHTFQTECCKPAADIHVVTSVHKETLEWLESVCQLLSGKKVRWFIFDKSGNHSYLEKPKWMLNDQGSGVGACSTLGWHHAPLPNVGREGHSWLTYIQTGVFAPTNIFLQGNPEFPLADSILSALKHNDDNAKDETTKIIPIFPGPSYCRPNNNDIYFDMPFFHDDLIKVSSYFEKSLDSMCYFYRGQFIASSNALNQVRIKHAEFIGNTIMPALESGNDPPMGHALERMWQSIFEAR